MGYDDDATQVGTFLIGLLIGAVLLGAVWIIASKTTGDSVDAGTSSQARSSPSGSPSDTAHPAGPTRMERCTSAAGPALDQWEVHVGAMNKLVDGEITLQQATAFWNQTRVGAQRRIADFYDALSTLRRHSMDCPAPEMLNPASPALHSCTRQVAADVQALQEARTSIATWDEHVRHMEMLRMGTMSPATATRMWLSLWQQGVDELEAYRTAVRTAQKVAGCPA